MSPFKLLSSGFITAVLLALIQPAHPAPLTIQQVANFAGDAGFFGGSLVSAVAAAEAESGFDPDIVNNNLHQNQHQTLVAGAVGQRSRRLGLGGSPDEVLCVGFATGGAGL